MAAHEKGIDYSSLMLRALRKVPHDALTYVEETGILPGKHHFFIEFITGYPGVVVPDFLRAKYPERLTIVLQNQFYDLRVASEYFCVTLLFSRQRSRLSVPFRALTKFSDPSVPFGLQFDLELSSPMHEHELEKADTPPEKGNIIRMDHFTKSDD